MSLPPAPESSAFVTTYRWIARPFELMDACAAELGDAFTLHLPALPPIVMFSAPDTVKHVFADTGDVMAAGKFNQSLKAFLGDKSVLMADGPTHLRKRRLLLPPFHGERMAKYGDVMLSLADEVIDRMPLGEPFPLHAALNDIALNVIVRNVFGVDPGPREAAIRKSINETLEVLTWPPFLVPQMQIDLGPWSPWGRAVRRRAKTEALLLEEIERRRARGTEGRDDILSLLLSARDEEGRPMENDELLEELTTLLIAGHETTATAISWAFRWILATSEVEAKLLAELDHAANDGPLTSARIAALPYLDAVAREALRLQPVIPLVGRVLEEPTRVGGWDLPRGTAVVCSIYLAQRRPDTYPEPSKFRPERFLGKKLTPSEFFPFGGGVRRCIGMAFALSEMKMVMAALLLRTRLSLAAKKDIRAVRRSITLTPSEGLRVRLLERRPSPVLLSA